jgi:hypothetical protein
MTYDVAADIRLDPRLKAILASIPVERAGDVDSRSVRLRRNRRSRLRGNEPAAARELRNHPGRNLIGCVPGYSVPGRGDLAAGRINEAERNLRQALEIFPRIGRPEPPS